MIHCFEKKSLISYRLLQQLVTVGTTTAEAACYGSGTFKTVLMAQHTSTYGNSTYGYNAYTGSSWGSSTYGNQSYGYSYNSGTTTNCLMLLWRIWQWLQL